MECSKTQEKLSAYIDGILAPDEKALVEEHLKSCQKCSAAFANIKKIIEHVKSLEEVEPPFWLTHKIMARVRSEAEQKKGIMQKLFHPLYIKVPIGAVATIAIAVTTFYIFKTIEHEVKVAETPSEISAPQILTHEEKAPQRDIKGKEKLIPRFTPAKPAEQPISAKEFETKAGKYEAPAKTPETFELPKLLKEEKSPAAGMKQDEFIQYAAPAPIKDDLKRETAPKLKAFAQIKTESITLSISVKDIENNSKYIGKAVTQSGGKIIKTDSLENKQILTVELNSKKLKELYEKLKLIGEIKEKESDLETGECRKDIECETTRVKIIILY